MPTPLTIQTQMGSFAGKFISLVNKLSQGKTEIQDPQTHINKSPEQNIKFTVTCKSWPWGKVSKESPKRTVGSGWDEACSSKYETEQSQSKIDLLDHFYCEHDKIKKNI